tara:strand:- start:614 stop:772 length:159 start_codon:yes stop_codon:yes gene_type:complete
VPLEVRKMIEIKIKIRTAHVETLLVEVLRKNLESGSISESDFDYKREVTKND